MKRDLKYERFYPHSPQRVWQALTDSRALADWYMPNDFLPVLGHKFRFEAEPAPGFDGLLYCEVVEVDEPHKLAYTFRGGTMQNKTLVTWTLTTQNGGTLVRLEHSGFTGLSDVAVAGIIDTGWQGFLTQLPVTLDKLAMARSMKDD